MTTVDADGVTLGVEHFGDAAAPLVLLAGGTPLPTPDPDRSQPADPDPSECGTVEDPCPAKVAPMPPSKGDNDPDVRTTFTYFTIYDQHGTVDSIHARP